MWRDSWLAIGDAAWSLDPLSGSGIDRAIRGGYASAAAISEAINNGNFELLRAHAVSQATAFQEALLLQQKYYEIEGRWKERPFWYRRA
jgi:flavin-dependent dehydrogenase